MSKIISLTAVFTFLLFGLSYAQDKADRPSPPQTAAATVNGGVVTIDYSSPAVKGRTIWGDLVPYGKVWRTGANEASTITFEKDVMINDVSIPAGKYGLFTIPGEKEWTIILNDVWDQWGAYNYDSAKDEVRFNVKLMKTKELQERLTFAVSEKGKVDMMWEHAHIAFNIK